MQNFERYLENKYRSSEAYQPGEYFWTGDGSWGELVDLIFVATEDEDWLEKKGWDLEKVDAEVMFFVLVSEDLLDRELRGPNEVQDFRSFIRGLGGEIHPRVLVGDRGFYIPISFSGEKEEVERIGDRIRDLWVSEIESKVKQLAHYLGEE